MDTKVQIVSTFHRFVSGGEGKPENKESFAAGSSPTVPAADAELFIAQGLARAIETPPRKLPPPRDNEPAPA